jgi:hypothetical protein
MLDPTAMPVLLRTLDFLFEEGAKILQERRERRNIKKEPKEETTSEVASDKRGEAKAIQSKEKALTTQITQTSWSTSEAEITHLLSLLDVYTKNYYLAKEQYAKFGSALVPQIVMHNLEEAESGIEATMKKLKSVLGNAYGAAIIVPEID